jgi:hypothetical protein
MTLLLDGFPDPDKLLAVEGERDSIFERQGDCGTSSGFRFRAVRGALHDDRSSPQPWSC